MKGNNTKMIEHEAIIKRILFEDNHILVVHKLPGEISQRDKSGDRSLPDLLKSYIKDKYNKPGDVFLGVVHRIDRPVGGVMVFARTSKALSRLNEAIRNREFNKYYLALTLNKPKNIKGELKHLLVKNQKLNKSYVAKENNPNAKEARLLYEHLGSSDRYHLLKIDLLTGRHHQIRVQLAAENCIIKGDLKYNAPRSNPDGNISLFSWKLNFPHPISKERLSFYAPIPEIEPWKSLKKFIKLHISSVSI